MDSTMQQRREEILQKKAKLAELKRQRELRKTEASNRQSLNGSPLNDVRLPPFAARKQALTPPRYSHQHHAGATTTSTATSTTSSTA